MNFFDEIERIVGIHGVPRSGTSWLGQILNSSPEITYRYQPLFSYKHKGAINDKSSRTEICDFLNDILHTTDDFVLQKDLTIHRDYTVFPKNSGASTLVFKHVRYHYVLENFLDRLPEAKIIGLVRNPCAVINSWLKAPREFDKTWDPLLEWKNAEHKNQGRREEYYGYERWKEVVSLFLKLQRIYPKTFFLLKYENLHESPLSMTKELFKFMGLRLTDATKEFIKKTQSTQDDSPYSVYRFQHDHNAWKKELDPNIIDTIMEDVSNMQFAEFL